MGIEQWGGLELAAAIVAYWAALFVGVVLYGRWRARRILAHQIATVVQPPADGDRPAVETTQSGIAVKFEERIKLFVIGLYLLGPPLVLALIRFWF
jgi:hypothetical protein